MLVLAMIAGACLNAGNGRAASKDADEDAAPTGSHEEQQKAAAAARARDPKWKPKCVESGLIQIGNSKEPGTLKNFCLNADGNILACFGPGIRVYSPAGELLKTLPLEIKPAAISLAKDGSIFVAGDGRLLKLDAAGKVLASAPSPVAKEPVKITKETEEMVKEMIKETKKSLKEELANMKFNLEKRRSDVTGLAVTDQDVFMAVPSPSDFTYRVYRFDHQLKNQKLTVEKLRGCCAQMDIKAHDGNLLVSHNARHSVQSHDRDGKELMKFGKAGRVKPSDFGGCCEPKCIRVLSNGDILAAESGPPTCIKRFSASGKFVEVVAVVEDTKGDCVRVTVDVSPDGSRYYMLDTTRDAIRVFKAKG